MRRRRRTLAEEVEDLDRAVADLRRALARAARDVVLAALVRR